MFKPQSHPASSRRAFTLIEMMVVVSIVILLLAAAVPAFRYITGSRSVDTGQNLIAAMLNRARAEAVRDKQEMGVAFFLDPKTDRTMMALVSLASVTTQTNVEAAGMEQYRSWQASTVTPPNTVTYSVGDVVCYASLKSPTTGERKRAVHLFSCKQAISNSSTANEPPDQPWTPTFNQYWGEITGSDIDSFTTVDYQALPSGISVQLINDPRGNPAVDRFVRFGMILFDSTGRLECKLYSVQKTSNLGQAVGLTQDLLDTSATPAPFMYSQLGVAIYETEPFRNVSGSTEGDYVMRNYMPNSPSTVQPELGSNANPDNSTDGEEAWIRQNALILFVDRASGALTKTE
ncbi:MAG TPA: prepilin-type N-terminal cleavage/methylation domain-containing protein [Tepidisphaeraceae bacterium]|jgi:prepilin-type N-terminal cleavage/methylation domain-containing protein|nr:prepilin-type N-terminal cleavage/methylation domain-containing protein [Tepidisphaeraceae bacterium]